MRRLPTASALPRVMACPASHVLPHVHSLHDSEWSARGKAVHAFIARAKETGRDAALDAIPDEHHRALCEVLPIDRIPDGADYESAMAYDYATGLARRLPTGGGRDYSQALSTEYVGTADIVGVDGDAVVVIDWKSGFRSLGPAEASRQLRFLALCAARISGKDRARVAFGWLRDGEIIFQWGELDVFDLSAVADELERLAERLAVLSVSMTTPDVSTGDHCVYCPAKMACPAYVGLAPAINSDLPSADRLHMLTPQQLGETYRKVQLAEEVIDHVKRGIREIAKEHPVPLGGDKYLRTEQRSFTSIDARKVLDLLTEAMGEAAAMQSVEVKATKTSIESALAHLPTAQRKETLEMLERQGAIRVGQRNEVREGKMK